MAASSFMGLYSRRLHAAEGDLQKDPAGVLDLPMGFEYKILQKSGTKMSDGFVMPGQPDGMSCFTAPNGDLILMRNHELSDELSYFSPRLYAKDLSLFYDQNGYGGVSRVVLDPKTMDVKSSNLVLAGSTMNCAGGRSPWGWVSCEETVDQGHGYAFVCDPLASSLKKPHILPFLGRFKHEAYAYDALSGCSYLTEDREDGCFYRYQPEDPKEPWGKGKLQALRVKDKDRFYTSNHMPKGQSLVIDWVDISDPAPKRDTCRFQGQSKGAAIFSRGEGLWCENGEVFFSATNAGRLGKGQIYRLIDADKRLELLCESEDIDALDYPDNITVAPWGDLAIAEDGSGEQYLRLLTRNGQMATIARNSISDSEFTGVTFSPDGGTLFANIQKDGLTLAISGPFEEYAKQAGNVSGLWTKPF